VIAFEKALEDTADDITRTIERILEMNDEPEARLIEAMRYAALDGGKRVRPYLTLATADMFNVKKERALQVAAAIELVHCYSLVHDDLPSMDDDDLRRGKPSCHNKFGEATAILAGDALLTKAFEVLSSASVHSDPNIRSDLVMALAKAAGHEGMVGGQMLDIIAESEILNTPETTRLQRMKTGMLIAVSCEVGAILGEASESAKNVLNAYAHNLGIAFQITDDLLDEEGNAKTVGKKTGKDKEAGKSTFVSLLGIDRARDQAKALVFEACEHLNFFGKKADPLKNMAQFVITRSA
tara:strand:- start:48 stop:935 length:888 start_codon:yes stop_codon:yes gene_type:complete